MSDTVPTFSLEELNALSPEQKDAAMYNAIKALTEEVAGLRRRVAELERHQHQYQYQYQQQQQQQQQAAALPAASPPAATGTTAEKRCYVCHEPGHVKRQCPERANRADQPTPVPNFQGANVKIFNIYKGKGKDHGRAL
ncbi:transcriptional regulator family: Zinc finger, CCHC-type [Trichoderma aggressivum f. europaeum]|uniref:Transcriptional regulator family: Zinc finger, CCHC-type n=1 Tax=Trichoderma aggressivum f. europaeum TaxID=173218 RepID=A0AAE1M4M7_9HYPO|nr:transcriptional regulator family: Zinc finger, CCHC-type [Trichoderma aggressivum f. europaeum]